MLHKQNSNASPMVSSQNKYKIDYFIAGLEYEAYMKASALLAQSIPKEFKDDFICISCFKKTFLYQIKDGAKPYQGFWDM